MIEATDSDNPSTTPRKIKKRIWSVLIGAIVSSFLLYLALRGLNWTDFANSVQTANLKYLIVAFPISSLSYYIRALRWRVLVTSKKKFQVKTVFWANMVGYLGNAFLPARMGEALRSYLLGKQGEHLTTFIFATAVTERVIDLCVLVTGAAIALQFFPGFPHVLSIAIQTMAIMGLTGLAIIFVASKTEIWLYKILDLVPWPIKFRTMFINLIGSFIKGLISLRSFERFWPFMCYTIVIWFLDTAGSVIFSQSIGKLLTFQQGFFLLACLGISSALPSTPGYIGVYQFVAVTVLVPFGFLRGEALAYILLLQGVGYLTVIIWGLIGLFHFRKTIYSFSSSYFLPKV